MSEPPSPNSIRPAWVEIDMGRLRHNFEVIARDRPANLQVLSVVKDQAYGHGAAKVAQVAVEQGSVYLAVATVDEALELESSQVAAPILVFGERSREELEICLDKNFTCCINDLRSARELTALAEKMAKRPKVHIEIDSGLNRYGVRWDKAMPVIEALAHMKSLVIEGIMSHFAMSDELDKSFALQQLQRFQQVLRLAKERGIQMTYRHMCNTGGFLDLPQAHFDMVRLGILPLGVFPSKVCRRIPGLRPVMSVKARIATTREIFPGDFVGYGMRYEAKQVARLAVLPIGYGDGYPRVRNQGSVLIRGQRAPIIGGNAMDAMMVDISQIPAAQPWDEVVLMGRQGDDEISVHEIADLKGSVSYEVLTCWRSRLPRVYLEGKSPS